MERAGDVLLVDETRHDLIARGWSEGDADQAIAFRVYLERLENPGLQPTRADSEFEAGMLSGRGYLERVAPEELER